MKFKVGDRVRRKIANSHWKAIFGEQTEGIVTYVNGDDILIDAKNQNGINDTSRFSAWSPDNFELVDEGKRGRKVGDKVKIIEKLTKDRDDYRCGFVAEMDEYLGTIQTIISISDNNTYILKGIDYNWSEEMFDDTFWDLESDNKMVYQTAPEMRISMSLEGKSLYYYREDNSIMINSNGIIIPSVVTPQEGEKKMNKIVELYESRRMLEINKNESVEIEKIKETESPLRKKIMKLKEDTEKELNKLYMSQFTKEQIKEFETVGILDTADIEVMKRGNVTLGIDLSNDYKKEDIEKIEKQADVLRDELHTKIAEINAMLSIIPENETEKIMLVLVRYGVVTEQGNLTI